MNVLETLVLQKNRCLACMPEQRYGLSQTCLPMPSSRTGEFVGWGIRLSLSPILDVEMTQQLSKDSFPLGKLRCSYGLNAQKSFMSFTWSAGAVHMQDMEK